VQRQSSAIQNSPEPKTNWLWTIHAVEHQKAAPLPSMTIGQRPRIPVVEQAAWLGRTPPEARPSHFTPRHHFIPLLGLDVLDSSRDLHHGVNDDLDRQFIASRPRLTERFSDFLRRMMHK
jgi:hypothetical protein